MKVIRMGQMKILCTCTRPRIRKNAESINIKEDLTVARHRSVSFDSLSVDLFTEKLAYSLANTGNNDNKGF